MSQPPTMPNWDEEPLIPGILREAVPEKQRLVVWMPGENDGSCQFWKRISTVPHAEIHKREGIASLPSVVQQAKQPKPRFFDKILRLFRRSDAKHTWMLPNGETVDLCGDRQTGFQLAWSEERNRPLEETQIRKIWPQSEKILPLGPNLFLIGSEKAVVIAESKPVPLPTDKESRREAENLLISARQKGDRAAEASALADLGVLALEQRQESQSVAYLENALALAQALGDQTRELDILPNLGLATLRIKQPDKAMQYLEKALNMARAAQDRFAEKFALERLGTVYAGIGNLPRSLRLLGESLAIAHDLCDRKHEAELLWHIGIRQAESGQREQAMNYAKAAIHLLESVGNPEANVYREHLQKFEQGAALAGLQGAVESTSNGVIVTTSQTSAGSTTPDRVGPGYLRMATSAAKAFTRFLGSGLKTVTVETMEKRLKQCAACRHHTGMRCRICGCFTNLKARLPHEQCSLGLWAENQN